jgi:hypothetical protein
MTDRDEILHELALRRRGRYRPFRRWGYREFRLATWMRW